jgi:hypothetical protein
MPYLHTHARYLHSERKPGTHSVEIQKEQSICFNTTLWLLATLQGPLLQVGTVSFLNVTLLIQRVVQIITPLVANLPWQHLKGSYNGGANKGAPVLQPRADCSVKCAACSEVQH